MADERTQADPKKYPPENTMVSANVMASAAEQQGTAYPSPPLGAPSANRADFNPDARPVPSGVPGMKRYRAREASYISDRVIQPGHIVEFPEDMEVGPNYELIDDENQPVVDPKKTHRLPRV